MYPAIRLNPYLALQITSTPTFSKALEEVPTQTPNGDGGGGLCKAMSNNVLLFYPLMYFTNQKNHLE